MNSLLDDSDKAKRSRLYIVSLYGALSVHGVVLSGPLVFISIYRYNFFHGSGPDTIFPPGCVL